MNSFGFARMYVLVGVAVCLGPATATGGDLTWEGGITSVYQHADDDRVDDEWTASADLFITVPQGSGEWLIYVEASTSPDAGGISALYPTANADAGSVIDRDGDGGVQISELNYTFKLSDGRMLMLGLIDPSAWLDRSRIANDENQHFLNGSFVNNATIEWPDYTLGGVFRWLGSETRPEIALVVASSDGLADLPERSYQELLDLTADERGLFIGAGASWLGEHTSARLGTWLRTDDHLVGGRPSDTEMNYGAYAVLGWHAGVHAVSARAGMANDRVSVATRFVALAYERQTPWGLLGAGVARTSLSDNLSSGDLADATDVEVFYRIPIAGDAAHITPSIQYLEYPDLRVSDGTADASAVVAGVRVRWNF